MGKIVIDRSRCTGLGICEAFAPNYFEVDDAGEPLVLREEFDTEDLGIVEQAINSCPTRALKVDQ